MKATASKARRSNMSKLREASRIAMSHPVLICMYVDELKTLSLAPWCEPHKPAIFRAMYQELGTFRAMPGETRYDVFLRLWEEAEFAGALLGARPNEVWVSGIT